MKFIVYRHDGTVDEVHLLKHKEERTYSFVNITKGHICTCIFDSIGEAIEDIDSYVNKGKIKEYKIEDDE